MSKMLKVIAMLLVIAAVVFVAGCAQKPSAPANETPAAPAETNKTEVAPTENATSAVMPAENNTSAVMPAENNTSAVAPAENNTSAPAATGATNLGTAARHRALIESAQKANESQQQSNSTVNVTQY